MKYEDRVVCFLDVLGFASHIRATVKDDVDQEAAIENINAAFLELRELLDLDKPSAMFSKTVTQFSDSIVISFPVDEESGVFWALLGILWIQIGLVYRGMLCRGGVARGKVIHNEHVLFGPAVVDAYELESKAANYPRVVLDESIINLGGKAHASHHGPGHEIEAIGELLGKDSDGLYFIDYLTSAQSELNDPADYPGYLDRLAALITKGLKDERPAVRVKYLWMREKLRPHIADLKAFALKESGDELADAYMALPDL